MSMTLKGKFKLERNASGDNCLIYQDKGFKWNVALLSSEGITMIPFIFSCKDFAVDDKGYMVITNLKELNQ